MPFELVALFDVSLRVGFKRMKELDCMTEEGGGSAAALSHLLFFATHDRRDF